MIIKSATFKNFKCFEDITFEDFDPHFNLIIGENGSGKSTFLEGFLERIGKSINNDTIDEFFARLTTKNNNGYLTLEKNTPVEVCLNFDPPLLNSDDLNDENYYLNHIFKHNSTSNLESGYEPPINLKILKHAKKEDNNFLIANYPTTRNNFNTYKNTKPTDTLISKHTREEGYENWQGMGDDKRKHFDWLLQGILKTDIAKGRGNYNPNEFDPIEIINIIFKNFFEGCKGIYYENNLYFTLCLEFENNRLIPFDYLSDGQKAMMFLVSDVTRRAIQLNPQHGNKVLELARGVVLIDELDLHLHPKWQRHIVSALKKTFPEIQFFATTHSPQIIGECRAEEIIILDDREEKGWKRPLASYGVSSNDILKNIMDAGERNKDVNVLIGQAFRAINIGQIAEAQKITQELREQMGDAGDVIRLEAFLDRQIRAEVAE